VLGPVRDNPTLVRARERATEYAALSEGSPSGGFRYRNHDRAGFPLLMKSGVSGAPRRFRVGWVPGDGVRPDHDRSREGLLKAAPDIELD